MQGGGWCQNPPECSKRANTPLGSSNSYPDFVYNPDPYATAAMFNVFHDWNHFVLPYCDGGSWLGEGRTTLELSFHKIASFKLKNIIVTGCSAGGLAVIHACKWIREMFPKLHIVCMHDGSLFFGDMRNMIEFHKGNVTYYDAVDVIHSTKVDNMYFTVTDIWVWDFMTSTECKEDNKCNKLEKRNKKARENIIQRVSINQSIWVTSQSYHCQLGVDIPYNLEKMIRKSMIL